MIVGNDISGAQGDINYDIYIKNSNFNIFKATEGVGFVDPKFSKNQYSFRNRAFPIGYYHFARPDLNNSPESEAEFFLSIIGPLQNGEVLCLDYEPNWPGGDAVGWCKRFLDHVQTKTGVKAFIYLNKSQVRNFDWSPVANAGYALWLACYDNNLINGAWSFVAMQQWTSSQQVPGISGNVDGDYFFGDTTAFGKYGYKKQPQSSASSSASPSISPSSSDSPSNSSSGSSSISPSASISSSQSPSPSQEIPPMPPTPSPFFLLLQEIWDAIRKFFHQ